MSDYDPIFGATTLKLSPSQWTCTILLSAVLLSGIPLLWFQALPLASGNGYRIPYQVSRDYALYEQHLKTAAKESNAIFVVGDSVVWGEYVRNHGTLSHFLREQDPGRMYVNAGINGQFPLALEGLMTYYGEPLRGRKVLLHCNLLWMSSPEADLSIEKERVFNHVELVPQFRVDIPCYRADITQRTARVVRHWIPHLRWVRHLQVVNFEAQSIPDWTLRDDGSYPPSYPNTYQNPFSRIQPRVPQEPEIDAERGLDSSRHQPWSESGRGTQSFEWVAMDQSLQWAAFRRLTNVLAARGCDVLVVLGPFNEHMLPSENLDRYRDSRRQVEAWLEQRGIEFLSPPVLPSELYGDASHPLTEGYQLMAERLLDQPAFRDWLGSEQDN